MRCALAAIIAVIGCLVLGCGMTQSSTHVDPADASGPPPPTTNANPPWSMASSNDLALWYCHVHQDYFSDPTHFGFWWGIRSTFSTTVASIDWTIERLDGTPQPPLTGTITNIPAYNTGGDGHEHSAEWTELQPGARHTYRLTINASQTQPEASSINDSYVFVVDVPSTTTANLSGNLVYYAREAHFHAMMPDEQFIFHFEAQNLTGAAIPSTKWRLQDPLEGIDITNDLEALADQAIAETHQTVTLHTPGLHVVTQTLDSADQLSESNRKLNVRTFYVLVNAPLGDG
jgi:hypothetical protein